HLPVRLRVQAVVGADDAVLVDIDGAHGVAVVAHHVLATSIRHRLDQIDHLVGRTHRGIPRQRFAAGALGTLQATTHGRLLDGLNFYATDRCFHDGVHDQKIIPSGPICLRPLALAHSASSCAMYAASFAALATV